MIKPSSLHGLFNRTLHTVSCRLNVMSSLLNWGSIGIMQYHHSKDAQPLMPYNHPSIHLSISLHKLLSSRHNTDSWWHYGLRVAGLQNNNYLKACSEQTMPKVTSPLNSSAALEESSMGTCCCCCSGLPRGRRLETMRCSCQLLASAKLAHK